MTKKQRRMERAVTYLTNYMNTYQQQEGWRDYSDQTFIDDVLYGLGVALHGPECKFAPGFDRFKAQLREHLNRTAPTE